MNKVMTKKFESTSERGIATIESALLLSIFIVFMTYCIGTFGVIHSGIMNSISARAYAFETFRNRTNVTYFRDQPGEEPEQTKKFGVRVHGVTSEKSTNSSDQWFVTDRSLAKGRDVANVRDKPSADKMNDLMYRKREIAGANPVYIKTAYGMCLNYECGGD